MTQAKKHQLSIVHLYPREMNLYGDTGNRLIIEKRLEWRGIDYSIHDISSGDTMPKKVDLILGGGGQDASQGIIEKDFYTRKKTMQELVDGGTAMLMICGMYQMMGRRFITHEGIEIKGLGILPVETVAKKGRLIGNIAVEIPGIGVIVGYENHSGRTYLDSNAHPLGTVIRGIGNNDDADSEGCRLRNVIGTYMHGPILAKNPELADLLIDMACKHAGIVGKLKPLDDTEEIIAREHALKRPR